MEKCIQLSHLKLVKLNYLCLHTPLSFKFLCLHTPLSFLCLHTPPSFLCLHTSLSCTVLFKLLFCQTGVFDQWRHQGGTPRWRLRPLPACPLPRQKEKWQESAIFGNFFDFLHQPILPQRCPHEKKIWCRLCL